MKVIELPEAAGFVPLVMAMETDGATEGLMVIVMLLLVAVAVEAQVRLEVMTQETTAPFVKEEEL